MKTVNILVTSLGGDIGGNIVNILLKQENVKLFIVGTDIKKNIFSSDQIDKFYQIDKVDSLEFYKQLVRIIQKNSIKIILPVSEKEIIWFNKNRKLFASLNVEIVINKHKIVKTFFNKLKTSEQLKRIGVNTPKTHLFSKFKNKLAFPLILKSNYSVKTKDIYIINNQNQLNYLNICIENKNDYIIQEYIGSIEDEYTTTVYRSNEKFETITFKRELTGGMTSFATVSNEKVLVSYAKKIAEFYDLKGSINIQSRKIGNKFYIFEINPRFSSTVYIRDYYGFQDVLWWLNDIYCESIFNLKKTNIGTSGKAILGYKYKFFENK